MTKTIIWDFDDVLFNTLYYWTQWYNEQNGTIIQYENIVENPPLIAAGINYEEYRMSMDAFRNSDFARSIEPDKSLIEWFEKYGDHFIHVVLTARPLSTMPAASRWIYTHFGRWIHTISHISSPRPNDRIHNHFSKKGDWINYFNPTGYYIDDSPAHIASVNSDKITPLLLSRPWNDSSLQMPEILIRIITETGS